MEECAKADQPHNKHGLQILLPRHWENRGSWNLPFSLSNISKLENLFRNQITQNTFRGTGQTSTTEERKRVGQGLDRDRHAFHCLSRLSGNYRN